MWFLYSFVIFPLFVGIVIYVIGSAIEDSIKNRLTVTEESHLKDIASHPSKTLSLLISHKNSKELMYKPSDDILTLEQQLLVQESIESVRNWESKIATRIEFIKKYINHKNVTPEMRKSLQEQLDLLKSVELLEIA